MFRSNRLQIDPTAFVAPGAILVGDVEVGAHASIWFGCVIRGDIEPIVIGPRSNLQDGTIVHTDHGFPTVIGEAVSIGHRAVVHGAVLEDGCLIGMGAVVLSGSRVGREALVAAGALVRERFTVPPRAICAGVPGKLRGEVDDALLARIRFGVVSYTECAAGYLDGVLGGGAHGGS